MVYGEVLVILAQVVWAIALLLQKKVVGNVDPLTVTFVSSLAGSLVLTPFILTKDISISRVDLMYLIIAGTLWIAAGEFIYISGLKLTTASRASLLALTFPVFVTVLAIIFLGEQITWKFILASILIATGIIVMVI